MSSGPPGSAIDPTLLMFQQSRAAAAAAASASAPAPAMQQQDGGSSNAAAVKQEDASAGASGPQSTSEDHLMDPSLLSGSARAVNGRPTSPQAVSSAAVAAARPADSLEAGPVDLHDDADLAAFLAKMDDYEPILPDSVTRFYLEKAGFQSSDDRVTRMLGLAAQKFVSDVAKDAYAFARTRTTAGPGRNPGAGNTQSSTSGKNKDRTKTVLTMDDLSAALHEYGVDASRAPYYR